MTVTWERFSGNTEIFAIRVSFMPDPDEGYGATPEESSSWGALQLWVDGHNLCAHIDQGEVLQSAHWYLLPLLEWAVVNWNPILHEERLPNTNKADSAVEALSVWWNAPPLASDSESFSWEQAAYEWWSRHALRSNRSGGLVPNVFIRRLRDLLEVSWNDDRVAGTPRGFAYGATGGRILLEPEAVAIPFHEVVRAAVDHLKALPAAGSRIALLDAKLGELEASSQNDVRLGWLAGLPHENLHGGVGGDSYELTSEDGVSWSAIVAALRNAGDDTAVRETLAVDSSTLVVGGSCHATLLFSSLSPTITDTDLEIFAKLLVGAYSSDPLTALDEHVSDVQIDARTPPWEQGYELAESLHAELDLDLRQGWVDVTGLLDSLGVRVLPGKLQDRDIRACSVVGPSHVPTIIQNAQSSFYESYGARRFNLAHELCHLLYDRSRGRKLAIASGPWAPAVIEKRANAFAAMFLMPTELIARVVAGLSVSITTLDGIGAVARQFRTSRRAAVEHLYNLTFMSDADREDLLKQL